MPAKAAQTLRAVNNRVGRANKHLKLHMAENLSLEGGGENSFVRKEEVFSPSLLPTSPALPSLVYFVSLFLTKRKSSICGTGLFLFNSSCAHSPHTGLVKFAQSDKVVSQA